jgi:hypothetical protein
MKTRNAAKCALFGALAVALFATPTLQAQTRPVASRITAEVDDTRTVQLKGNVHPMARPEFDRGAVADTQPMTRMLLLLQRSPEQETTLQQLMDAQQTKGSGNYQAWLTPEQFGQQFGPSDADVQAVTDWLGRQGFQVAKVAAGRNVIEFSGIAGQVRSAFHTEIHKFAVNGEEHVANVSDPAIPEALAPVVAGVTALHNFPRLPQYHNKGVYRLQRDTGELKPLFTYGNPANYAMAPADFEKVYSIPNTATGSGVTIAIVGQSNINAQDVIDFRTLFGLSQNFSQANNVIINGPDPGLVGVGQSSSDEGESDLDVEWSGAIAPAAKILLVSSAATESNPNQITAGTDLSALYIVDNNIAPILSESYGGCEFYLGSGGNLFFNFLWQQAAAEGITVVVATGDAGSAACDPDPNFNSPNAAVDGTTVNGIASTPYNVAVGGTDFDPSAEPAVPPNQYWSAANGLTNGSALKYIPETTWNDSACAINYPAACTGVDSFGADLSGGGGGPSNCSIFTGTKCNTGYPKPAFQTTLNTAFTTRTIPDVSFFASNGGPPSLAASAVAEIVCQADNINFQRGASCSLASPFTDFGLVGGTSASTPSFAGIVALLIQANGGKRVGNLNYGLYFLAANDANYTGGLCNSSLGSTPAATCVFNDVTKGNNGVACLLGSPNLFNGATNWCAGTNATFGVTVSPQSSPAYAAGAGYDAATGLGSINVTNLLAKWSTFTRAATTTTVTAPVGGSPSGQNFTATVIVTPAGATGTVSLTALKSDQTTVLGSYGATASTGPFNVSVATGIATVQTNLLPPGTAYVSATYGGDSTHGMSTSTPVALAGTVAGANFASATTLYFVTFDANNNPILSNSSTQSVPYGTSYILNISVTKSGSNTTCGFAYSNVIVPALPCPTGAITLTDGGNALNDFPSGPNFNVSNMAKINNQGLAEDFFIQLAGSTTAHAIVAKFATADTNYGSSNSPTMNITITKAVTQTLVASSSTVVVMSGGTVNLTALVGSNSNSSQGPTGTVQFQNNGVNIGAAAATCTPAGANANGGASCTATLNNVPITALLPPTMRGPRPTLPVLPLLFALLSIVLFVLGLRWIPENRRRVYAYAGFLAFALLAVGIAGCGGGGGGGTGGGTNVTISAVYAGDSNYATSTGSIRINVQ